MFGRHPGGRAPDFRLPVAGTGDDVRSLSELQRDGPVLLLFFPFAFSPGCSSELKEFERKREQFERRGCSLVGISTDSPFTLRAFAEQLGIGFPLLSDFNRIASRRYGVLIDRWGLRGFADRAVFLVAGGRIAWSWRAPDLGVLPEPEWVLAALQDLAAGGDDGA